MESTIVTVNDLKNFTSIGENVDPEILYPHLLISQQLYIENLIGSSLYNDIVSRFDNQQLTGDTQTLYEEYIIPAVAYCAWYSAAPFINFKTQRTGISTHSSDVLTPVTPEEFAIYSKRVNNFKTYYLNRLEDYLIANKTLFPLFRQDKVNKNTGGQIFLGYKSVSHVAPYWDGPNTDSDDCADCP